MRRGSTTTAPRETAAAARLHDPLPGRPPREGTLEQCIVRAGLTLGFSRVGCCSAAPFERAQSRLERWTAAGHGGEMTYLTRPARRSDVADLLPEAGGVVAVALAYPGPRGDAIPAQGSKRLPLVGQIASYATFEDYHTLIGRKLRDLGDEIATIVGRRVRARACVDTAPLLERAVAERAGVGFIGKSTMAIVPGPGTYVLLAELVVDVALRDSEPVSAGCGSCTRCLDACPTKAFVGAYELDSRRCVSYLTIEHRGPIPRDLRAAMGTMIFGCDVCQSVCPFNGGRHAASEKPGRAAAHLDTPRLLDLLTMGSGAYRRLVKDTALRRVSRTRLQRNVAVALGNAGNDGAVPALVETLQGHTSALVRSHCAWALGRLPGQASRDALVAASTQDPDGGVREEARLALGQTAGLGTNHGELVR